MSSARMSQSGEMLKTFFGYLEQYRSAAGQRRNYERIVALAIAEILAFGRHTITQLLMALGLTKEDWSAWYRLFSNERFEVEAANRLVFKETLRYVDQAEPYVVVADATQIPRTGKKIEGVGWLRHPRTPPFYRGIHQSQRFAHGAWLVPPEKGYSRAVPLRFMPAFTEKSKPKHYLPRKEWECAIDFLKWCQQRLQEHGRGDQRLLMVGDGSYDTLKMWKHLPANVTLMARSAKNRALYYLPDADAHANRKYGERAPTPQDFWGKRQQQDWQKFNLTVRGKTRDIQYIVKGPFLRKTAPDCPLFLIIVRGKQRQRANGTISYRPPLPFLVNAVRADDDTWQLPYCAEQLIGWMWHRWEVEVAHREMKSNLGMGHKQCWNPVAAVLTVQWSAWIYAMMLLTALKLWGITGGPTVPTAWWQGGGRWTINTILRRFRQELWQELDFRPCWSPSPTNSGRNLDLSPLLTNILYGTHQL